jgi:DNA-binding XRE family transcriptional regulator
MKKNEFSTLRRVLEKTQSQMAQLLGVSSKAIQSFEQGWRNIPAHVERQALFLLALKTRTRGRIIPCWEVRHCSLQMRETCPAWELKVGHLCWFINGTICQGKSRSSWSKKMILCKKCKVFISFMKHWGFSQRAKSRSGG